jgi:hypothetical protein
MIEDAVGEVNGKMVGVMLLQSQGYLTCLEVYDLSDIEHPYGLPNLRTLRAFSRLNLARNVIQIVRRSETFALRTSIDSACKV